MEIVIIKCADGVLKFKQLGWATVKTSTRKVFKERFSWLDRNYQAQLDAGWTQVL